MAKRQARLAGLGFADMEAYLPVRRVEQRWSLQRTLSDLQVGSVSNVRATRPWPGFELPRGPRAGTGAGRFALDSQLVRAVPRACGGPESDQGSVVAGSEIGPELCAQIASLAVTDAGSVGQWLAAYAEAGAGEALLVPTSPELEQVDLLADAVAETAAEPARRRRAGFGPRRRDARRARADRAREDRRDALDRSRP